MNIFKNNVIISFFIIFTVIVFFNGSNKAFAGDIDNHKLIGFSKDGRYAAYSVYGVHDGSGFPYHKIRFVDIKRNVFVGSKIYIVMDNDIDNDPDPKIEAMRKAAYDLKRFGIIKGNTGEKVYTSNTRGNFSKIHTASFTATNINGKSYSYKLVLKEIPTGIKSEYMKEMEFYGYKISVSRSGWSKTLENISGKNSHNIGYSLETIHSYKGGIIVFYKSFSPGWEGGNETVMVTAAALN